MKTFEMYQWMVALEDKYGTETMRDWMALPADEFITRHGAELNESIETDQRNWERDRDA